MKRVVLGVLSGYQAFSRTFLMQRCRFAPSCSAYAVEAVSRYGVIRGLGLAVRRISHCHPFNPGGYDPVPTQLSGLTPSYDTPGVAR